MNFVGRAKRIEDVDLPRIGAMIGCGEDEIHAVIDVEAAGSGFDSKGRPKMLFEPHIFYRELTGKQRETATDANLAYEKWKPGKYPKDSYPRLERAMDINKTAALRSCSWGMGQIMGFNHVAAGYHSPIAMVTDFMDDEDNQLEGMINFIKTNHLDDELRAHNWAGFARGYNGSQYAKHGYHTKLEARYNFWAGIRDTPYDGAIPAPPDVPAPVSPPQKNIFAFFKGLF